MTEEDTFKALKRLPREQVRDKLSLTAQSFIRKDYYTHGSSWVDTYEKVIIESGWTLEDWSSWDD